VMSEGGHVRRNSLRNQQRNAKRKGKKGASSEGNVSRCDEEGAGWLYSVYSNVIHLDCYEIVCIFDFFVRDVCMM